MYIHALWWLPRFTHIRAAKGEKTADEITFDDAGRQAGNLLEVRIEKLLKDTIIPDHP